MRIFTGLFILAVAGLRSLSISAEQVDIGLFPSASPPNQLEVRCMPDYNIDGLPVTNIVYTVRWDNPSTTITPQFVMPFLVTPSGSPVAYGGWFYQIFVAVPFNAYVTWTAGSEYLISTFTYTGDCVNFQVVNDGWTLSHNGDYYLSIGGYDKTGIIYNSSCLTGSFGGMVTPDTTVVLGQSTGTMILSGESGDVVTWQRKLDNGPWDDIPQTAGQTIYEEIPSAAGTWYYRVLVQKDPCPAAASDSATVEVNGYCILDLKVFLHGPYDNGSMNTFLLMYWQFPFSQPYNIPPWNYAGTESITALPGNNIVDWMLIELRETPSGPESATPETMIARQAGFLLNDGSVVSTDGTSPMQFNCEITQNLFVVVHHRNHLSIMSSVPLTGIANHYAYDFRFDAGQAYMGTLAQVELGGAGSGIWGMPGGDGNRDGQVNNLDKLEVWIPQSGTSGYREGDFDLNGQVNNQDKVDIWKANGGKSCQVP
jgi:hypothetical protein